MTVNTKNTKAEILDAYKELEKEKKKLESEVKQLKVTSNIGTSDNRPKNQGSQTEKMNPTQLTQNNIEQTIKILEGLQLGFGSAVSKLSEQLIKEATSLQELQKAVMEERQQLQELHQVSKIEENTVDNLIQSYRDSAKTFTEEINQQRETKEQQIEGLKKAWQKEQENHNRQLKERDENYQKRQQRDEEEYEYNLDLQRDLDEEGYEWQKKNLYRELEETRQEQEKQWKEREESLSEQEKQYKQAKEKVEAFEEQLANKIKQAKEEGKNIGNYQARVKADLRAKEIEGEKQNYQLQIEALDKTIQNQDARIVSLSKQLDTTLKQVQDLAVKAIEGTSNRSSFEAMKEIALEQVKNQQKVK